MVEQNISRERLEEIIREELMSEGFFDRIGAKTAGASAGVKNFGSRLGQAAKLAATGKADLSKIKDPAVVKAATQAAYKVASFKKAFGKLIQDYDSDIKKITANTSLADVLPKVDYSISAFSRDLTSFYDKINTLQDQIVGSLQGGQAQDKATIPAPQKDTIPSPAGDERDTIPSPSNDEEDDNDRDTIPASKHRSAMTP